MRKKKNNYLHCNYSWQLSCMHSQTQSKRQDYFFLPQHTLRHLKSRGIAPSQTSFVSWTMFHTAVGSSLRFTGSFCAELLAVCVSELLDSELRFFVI